MLYNSASGVLVRTGCEDIRPDVRFPAGHLETKPQRTIAARQAIAMWRESPVGWWALR